MTANEDNAVLVNTERRGDVVLLYMADSARRNALSVPLVTQLIAALRASKAAGARAVVIGSKEKAFCAGADIRDMLTSGWLEGASGDKGLVTPPDLFEAIENDSRPVIAAVDGLALGGGVELCLACDLVVASASASFMFPELALGVLPNTALARLPELIGARAAAGLILTRRRIESAEALRLGLINTLADVADAAETALELGADIVANVPPTAFSAAKRSLRRGHHWTRTRELLDEMDPNEWREGTSAFIEKRRPDYERFWQRKHEDR